MDPRKQFLIDVFNDTKAKCLSGLFGALKESLPCVYYFNDPQFKKQIKKYNTTTIDVINGDVLIVAQNLMLSTGNNNILVLNLASASHAGGGVTRGAMAQEEELFRRTNYFMSLKQQYYPIKKAHVIVTPVVTVVKDERYKDLKDPFSVAMIAAAAVRQPQLSHDGTYNKYDYDLMLNTIDTIFRTAYELNYETLVLGALGCGAFRNPPHEVVKMFNICIKKYEGCFKNITFAVKSGAGNKNINNDNFEIFNKFISKQA